MIHIGIDPGLTGAIVGLDDERQVVFIYDMPTRIKSTTRKRNAKGAMVNKIKYEIDPLQVASILRSASQVQGGTVSLAITIERVNAMPSKDKETGESRDMGATSAFNFGEGFGMIRAVCELHGQVKLVVPTVWKKAMSLLTMEKDSARLKAINLFPAVVEQLKRKKDIGRADAMLIALHGYIQSEKL